MICGFVVHHIQQRSCCQLKQTYNLRPVHSLITFLALSENSIIMASIHLPDSLTFRHMIMRLRLMVVCVGFFLSSPGRGIAHQAVWPVSLVTGALGARWILFILRSTTNLEPRGKCSVMTGTHDAGSGSWLAPASGAGKEWRRGAEREAGDRTFAHMACPGEALAPRLPCLVAGGRAGMQQRYPSPSRVMWR